MRVLVCVCVCVLLNAMVSGPCPWARTWTESCIVVTASRGTICPLAVFVVYNRVSQTHIHTYKQIPSVTVSSDNHMLNFTKRPFRWHALTVKEIVVSKDNIHWRFHCIILMIEQHLGVFWSLHTLIRIRIYVPRGPRVINAETHTLKKKKKTREEASFSAHRKTWRYQAWRCPVALSAFQYQLSIYIINCCSTLRDTQGTNEPQISSLNMATRHQIPLSTTKSMTLAK